MRILLPSLLISCAARAPSPTAPSDVTVAAVPPAPLEVTTRSASPAAPRGPVASDDVVYQPCAAEGSLVSSASTEATAIRFVNDGDDVVLVAWLDFKGQRVPYQTLAPRASYLQSTYLTHPWILLGSHGCLGIVTAAAPGEHRVAISELAP